MSYRNTSKEERARKHNCDGNCYGGYTEHGRTGICGNIDTCPETQKGEFFATIVAVGTIVAVPIIVVITVIIFCYQYCTR